MRRTSAISAFNFDDPLEQQPSVGFDLGLAGAAKEAETAALAFQVGPCAHETRALVVEAGQLHLQAALGGAGAAGEDLQDQTGAVDDLDVPGALEIALLDGAQGAVNHDHVGVGLGDERADLGHLAGAEQGGRRHRPQGGDEGLGDPEVEGAGETARLGQPPVRVARGPGAAASRMDDEGGLDRIGAIDGRQSSSSSSAGS